MDNTNLDLYNVQRREDFRFGSIKETREMIDDRDDRYKISKIKKRIQYACKRVQ